MSRMCLRLAGQIGQLRNGRLHAEGHLVLGDARVDLRIAERLGGQLVELFHAVEHAAAPVGVDAGRVRQIEHRIAAGAEADPLMLASAKSRCPTAARRAADRSCCRCPAKS